MFHTVYQSKNVGLDASVHLHAMHHERGAHHVLVQVLHMVLHMVMMLQPCQPAGIPPVSCHPPFVDTGEAQQHIVVALPPAKSAGLFHQDVQYLIHKSDPQEAHMLSPHTLLAIHGLSMIRRLDILSPLAGYSCQWY